MVNKRGQMKIQQMAFMLIALSILFMMIILFAARGTLTSVKEKSTELREGNAINLVSTIANSPEFSCGTAYGKNRVNCVDLDKVVALKLHINDYKDFWGVNGIELVKVYPESTLLCNSENYLDCGVLKILDNNNLGVGYFSYVSLCHKEKGEFLTYDKCEISKLIVRVLNAK